MRWQDSRTNRTTNGWVHSLRLRRTKLRKARELKKEGKKEDLWENKRGKKRGKKRRKDKKTERTRRQKRKGKVEQRRLGGQKEQRDDKKVYKTGK